MSGRPHASLPWRRLRQPSAVTCGAAVAVVVRALHRSPEHPEISPEFAAEVVATHRSLSRPARGPAGAHLGWPRAVGTSPWALARSLTLSAGTRHRVRLARWRRIRAAVSIRRALEAGWPVPVYLGSASLPRHVVLALPSDDDGHRWLYYDPAAGAVRRLPLAAWTSATLPQGAWRTPWFAIVPDLPGG